MSAQPAVLQVVIMRDGLLVGTEVFVPGQYTLGSGLDVDLRLDDASVAPHHAVLYFQNGRSAIQDAGPQNTFVNGQRVNACEVRPVDEIAVGPFTLKVRVMAQKSVTRNAPPPDVAALLGGPAAPARPAAPAAPPAPAAAPPRGQPGATVVSTLAIALEAGVLLAAAFMLTRRLWMAIGLHAAWNFTEGGVFGASVSGGTPYGLLRSRFTGAPLLSGGAFGPEASIVAVVLCLSAGIAFCVYARRRGRFIVPFWRR